MAHEIVAFISMCFLPYPKYCNISILYFKFFPIFRFDSNILRVAFRHFDTPYIFSAIIHYDTSFFMVSSIFYYTINLTTT